MAESKCKIRRVFFTSPKACRPAWLRPHPLRRRRKQIQNRSVAPASCRRSRGRLALGTAGRACPERVERTLAPPELLRHRLCGGGGVGLAMAGRACPELVERTLAPPELLRHRLCGGGAVPRRVRGRAPLPHKLVRLL